MTWQVIVVSTARTWQVIVRVPVGVKSSVRIVEIILPWYLVKTTSKRRVMTHKSLLNNSKHITEAYLNLSANAWEKYGKPTKLSSRGEQTHRTCFPSLLEPRKDQYRLCTKGFVVFSSLRYYSGHRQFPDLAAIPISSYIIYKKPVWGERTMQQSCCITSLWLVCWEGGWEWAGPSVAVDEGYLIPTPILIYTLAPPLQHVKTTIGHHPLN